MVEGPKGKWADVLGHVFMVDIESMKDILIEFATDTLVDGIYNSDTDDPVLQLASTLIS